MKNKKLVIGIWLLVITWSLGFGIWSLPAGAVPDVTPAKSVVNPVVGALYYPENDSSPRIVVYKYVSPNWTPTGAVPISLPAGSASYGLAASADGAKLYVSINQGASSAIKVYNLDAEGMTTGSPASMTGASWSASSSPAGIALGGGNRLFVADKGVGRFRIFNTATNAYIKQITDHLAGLTNLYDVAVTSTTASSYKIYISRKIEAGEIYVFDYNASTDTATYVRTISGLVYPTYLKVYLGKLYVAVNGSDGVDIKVYNTSDDAAAGTVLSGVTGSYGWTGFDIAGTGWLIYKKAQNASESENRLFKITLANISTGSTATLARSGVSASDSVVIAPDRRMIALSNSRTGDFEGIDNNTGTLFPYDNPAVVSNLKQYYYDGTTEIPAGGLVATGYSIPEANRTVILKFDVADPDGNGIIPEIRRKVVTETTWAGWEQGEVLATGNGTATVQLPNLRSGRWEWRARARHVDAPYSASDQQTGATDFNGDTDNPDFITDNSTPDIDILVTDPANRAANVSTAKDIKIGFTDTVVPSTFQYTISPDPGGWAAPQWNAENTQVILHHDTQFNLNTAYTITVESAADAAGNNINPFRSATPGDLLARAWRFTTRAVNAAPGSFNLTAPINGAVVGAAPTLSWEESVDADGDLVTYNLTINNEVGTTIVNTSTILLSLTAGEPLPAGSYTWSVTSSDGVDSRVAANAPGSFRVIPDTPGAPTVTATVPTDGATDVATNQNITVTFSEAMNPAAVSLTTAGITFTRLSNNADQTEFTFSHDPAFAATTTYNIAIAGSDLGGTALGVSAALGANGTLDLTTGAETIVTTISGLSIIRDADAAGSAVSVSWQTAPSFHLLIKVFTKTGDYSLNAADWSDTTSSFTITPDGDRDKITDSGQVGNGTTKYYKIIPASASLTAADLTSDAAGKFDLVMIEGYNFVSIPLITTSNSIPSVIGTQLTGGIFPPLSDKIYKFKADHSGFDQAWLDNAGVWRNAESDDTGAFPESTMTIDPDTGYWIELAAGHASANVSIVGLISNAARGPIGIVSGYNLIGTTFPMVSTLENSGIRQSGATAGLFPPLACKIYSFRADHSGFDQAWLDSGGVWRNAESDADGAFPESTMQLTPGKAYWIEEPTGFSWNYPRPY